MLCARTLPRDNRFITPEHRVANIHPQKRKLNSYQKEPAYLLKLSGWPCGPLRTVMPEVPVEPALLGAGLVWLSDSCSVWNSVVLIATQSLHPGMQTWSNRRIGRMRSEGKGKAI